MLKLMVQPSPTRLACVCGLHLPLPKPQWQPGLRLPDARVVSAARHTTIASWSRRLVEAPAPAHGADTLRSRPWTAADWRAPMRHCIVADVVAYAHQSDQWPLSVRLDDS